MRSSIVNTAVWLAFTSALSSATPQYGYSKIQLNHWPAEAAKTLSEMIASNANQSNYAVFDMDNTSWHYDIEESLLSFLENRGILKRENLDPSLKLIDFRDTANFTESLFSYYNRLCDIDIFLCYPWAAQVWSGFTLRELKSYVDELMAFNSTVKTKYWNGDEIVFSDVHTPQPFLGITELYSALQSNGIAVYIMSASHEELVRMIASDPQYGYNVPPENVIGVTTILKNATSGELTNARKQIAAGTYNQTANLDLVMTPYLWTPATWFAGKWAGIITYIDQWKRPILVGGDTPGSDTYMQFQGVDVQKGGFHLWVNRKDSYFKQLQEEIKKNTLAQIANGREVTADKNWLVVKPEDIR